MTVPLEKFHFILLGHLNPIISAVMHCLIGFCCFQGEDRKTPNFSARVYPSFSLKSQRGNEKDVLSPATGREREALYSQHSLNVHSRQLREPQGEKSYAHTQPHGQTSQLRQPLARSSSRRPVDEAPHLGGPSPKEALPQGGATFQPRAKGPGTALVPHPTPTPRKR